MDHLTQRNAILEHLRNKGSITTLEAVLELHIMDSRKRISELRRDGHDIPDEWETSKAGKRYKRYFGHNLAV